MTQEDIYRTYHDRIEHYIYGKVSDKYTAEDLTSTVFLKIYEKFDTFDESKSSVSTWIYTIAGNTVIDYYRVHKVTEELDETIPHSGNIEAEVLQEEELGQLADALMQLKERDRDLIVMRYYYDMTLKDIAVKLGMSYANAKIVHQKALLKLRTLINIDD